MRSSAGFSVFEIVIVMAVLAALLSVSSVVINRPRLDINRASSDIQSFIQVGRFESIKRNVPVWLTLSNTLKTLTLQTDANSDDTPDTTLRTLKLSDYGTSTNLSATFGGSSLTSLRWTEDGLAQTSSGSVISSGYFDLSLGGLSRRICMSAGGALEAPNSSGSCP